MDPKLKSEISYRFLRRLKSQKDEDWLVDFTIIFGEDKQIRAHKSVLAAHSDYFSTMFTQTNTQEYIKSKVYLRDINYQTVCKLIDFCYTAELAMDEENAQDILIAASRLQFPSVQEMASEYICTMMDASNCLGIYMLAERILLPSLLERSLEFCLTHFEDVVNEEEFSHLEYSCLYSLISNERLKVPGEELVFQSVIRWAKVDLDGRKGYLNNLMYLVRFAMIEPQILVGLSDEPLVKEIPECQHYIDQAKDFQLLAAHPDERRKRGLLGFRFTERCA